MIFSERIWIFVPSTRQHGAHHNDISHHLQSPESDNIFRTPCMIWTDEARQLKTVQSVWENVHKLLPNVPQSNSKWYSLYEPRFSLFCLSVGRSVSRFLIISFKGRDVTVPAFLLEHFFFHRLKSRLSSRRNRDSNQAWMAILFC